VGVARSVLQRGQGRDIVRGAIVERVYFGGCLRAEGSVTHLSLHWVEPGGFTASLSMPRGLPPPERGAFIRVCLICRSLFIPGVHPRGVVRVVLFKGGVVYIVTVVGSADAKKGLRLANPEVWSQTHRQRDRRYDQSA